jgi:hypothetical protein
MKSFIATAAILFALCVLRLGSGCTVKQEKSSEASPATSTSQTEAPKVDKPAQPDSASTTTSGDRPIEFTCLGISPDKKSSAFRIKVITEKPIAQVDIYLKETDDSGKVLFEAPYAWTNVVKMAKEPIESGKTYDAEGYLYPGATKVECALQRVIFKDGSRWSAK